MVKHRSFIFRKDTGNSVIKIPSAFPFVRALLRSFRIQMVAQLLLKRNLRNFYFFREKQGDKLLPFPFGALRFCFENKEQRQCYQICIGFFRKYQIWRFCHFQDYLLSKSSGNIVQKIPFPSFVNIPFRIEMTAIEEQLGSGGLLNAY